VQGPESYLNEMGVTLTCAVAPDLPAILDTAHRIFVNWDTYFVSSDEARDAFVATPYRFTGYVTDPVSGVRFQPGPDSPSRERAGRLFYFSSAPNLALFEADPTGYDTPPFGMVEVAH